MEDALCFWTFDFFMGGEELEEEPSSYLGVDFFVLSMAFSYKKILTTQNCKRLVDKNSINIQGFIDSYCSNPNLVVVWCLNEWVFGRTTEE